MAHFPLSSLSKKSQQTPRSAQPKKPVNSRFCSIAVSGRGPTCSRQSPWAHKASYVRSLLHFTHISVLMLCLLWGIVARPFMYGLAINGQQGVEEVLRGILADTEITMGLSGYSNLKDIWGKREKFMRKVDAAII